MSILAETKEETPAKKPVKRNTAVGIDVGIKNFSVLSEGTEFDNPKYLKQSLVRLKVLQRSVSRKAKGSSNRKKSKRRLARIHEKISHQRKDFIHKVTDVITKQYDTICVEDLAVSNMVKNRKLSRSASDASWGMFGTILRYKAEWRGKNLIEIGSFEPGSKVSLGCGDHYKELSLPERGWECPGYGKEVLRDLKAAINIKNFGLKSLSGVERTAGPEELPAVVRALKQEKFVREGFV